MVDWNDLKWFAAVADAGSFRTAAAQTGLNHTTLSRRLRALEEALGTTLVHRSPGGLELTKAGREVRQSCEVLIEEVADLERRFAGKDQRPEGKVTLTYPDGFASQVVQAVALLGQTHPEISITHVLTEDNVDLTKREADIAVRASNGPPEDLLGRRIGTIAWSVYGAKSRYPEPPAELVPAEHDWIGFGGRWAEAPPTRWLQETVPASRIRAEVDDPQAIRELAASGLGLGMLMRVDGDRDARLTCVGPWPCPKPPASLWILIHPDMRRARRIRVVADHLFERLRSVEGAFEDRP